MKTRRNKFNIEWAFAKECWNALVNGQELPAVPKYSVWEVEENTGKQKLVKTVDIEPMRIVYQGKTYF